MRSMSHTTHTATAGAKFRDGDEASSWLCRPSGKGAVSAYECTRRVQWLQRVPDAPLPCIGGTGLTVLKMRLCRCSHQHLRRSVWLLPLSPPPPPPPPWPPLPHALA
eukprot:NODE_17937_length_919_cov_2.941919.p1 GENE.NODE_17937_length_919_cov_2.941919~~NODE_17937_length_919_cov_2.941919.p1  ORF type:complete len:107 (-),score=11.97 NODE_17937_length_919_cov_2.941919:58-378(-)